MEESAWAPPPITGSKHSNLKKSLKRGVRSLLTVCPREDFVKAFSGFSNAEKEHLYRMFIQVITSLHVNIEDEFELYCLETQVGTALDTVEQLVEEQSLDPLYNEKANVGDIKQDLSAAKKNEIQLLETFLSKAEDQKQLMEARIADLKMKIKDSSNATGAVKMLTSEMVKFNTISPAVNEQ